jgi:hypothetical protein
MRKLRKGENDVLTEMQIKIGLYRFETGTRHIMAQGMTCPTCGNWEESDMDGRARDKNKARKKWRVAKLKGIYYNSERQYIIAETAH